jgi:two-component system, OmpR family, sensor histidine kinase MtrB
VTTPAGRGRRLGLRRRLTLIFAIGALLLSTSVAVISYELSRNYLVRQRQTSLEQQAFVNARLVRSRIRAGETDVAALLASLSPRSTSQHLSLQDGQWTVGSPSADPSQVPAGLRSAVVSGRAGHQLFRLEGQPHMAVGVPIAEADLAYFAVYSLDVLDRTLTVLGNSLMVAALITTLVGAATGQWASRRVLQPLTDVAEASAAVAGGGLDVRLDAGNDPDLATVAKSFNRMTDALVARMERDARFASSVSHELRSPLSTLVASVEVVTAKRHELGAPAREALDLLADEVNLLVRLVEDLLEISRLEAGVADLALEEVNLDEFVHRAVGTSSSAGAQIDVQASVGSTVVRADKRRLERVLGNLISNAENYAGGVSRVAVEREDGVARIAVEDSGPGVPADEREQIFERFVRGRAAVKRRHDGGAGLGLSLVSEHVRAHDGRVWVEPSPSGGARFVVELPVVS